jgi:uncharacterized protein YhdP
MGGLTPTLEQLPAKDSVAFRLDEKDVEEFRALLRTHAGVDSSESEAAALAHQLVRLLGLVRSVALKTDPEPPVDKQPLPESPAGGINSNSSSS